MDPINLLASIAALLFGIALSALLFWRRLSARRDENQQLKIKLAQVEAALEAEKAKTTWTDAARQQLKDTFKALASDELIQRSEQLKTIAKYELGNIVAPLQKELDQLDTQVRRLEVKREGAYSSLGTQLETLGRLADSLRQQTTTLAQALKASNVKGQWGEVQLRRLVELAGMQDHVDFAEQESGTSGRPDMIVHLPPDGIIPVDSKVSLKSFLEAMESEDEQVRKQRLHDHAQALRSRIRELSQKAYWDQFKKTPGVVVMFVPIEASLAAAFQQDPEIFEEAMSNKVLISSPVVLFALLKAAAFGWQQQQVAENAAKIAEQGRILYDRVQTFINHVTAMGKSLEDSVSKYNDAVGSLEGRVLPAVRRFRELGVGTSEIEPPKPVDTRLRLPQSVSQDEEKGPRPVQ